MSEDAASTVYRREVREHARKYIILIGLPSWQVRQELLSVHDELLTEEESDKLGPVVTTD